MSEESHSRQEHGVTVDETLSLANVARQFAEQGRLESARTLLEGLAVLQPGSAYVQSCLGCVYMRLHLDREALECFALALEADSKDIVAHTYAGELLLEQGRLEPALERLGSAIELDPKGKDPHANRARTLKLLATTIRERTSERNPEVLREVVRKARLSGTEAVTPRD